MNQIEITGASLPPKRDRFGVLANGISVSLSVTIILCILALCQQFYGIGLTIRHEIKPDRIQKMPHYLRWKFPEPYRTLLMERRAAFFENDKQWTNLSVANRDLKELGPGWYHWVDGGVNFIPKNAGSAHVPASRYSVVSPLQFKPRVWWILGGLLIGQLLLFSHFQQGRPRPRWLSPSGLFSGQDSDPGWSGEAIVFGCALLSIFTSLYSNPDLTDHAFMVKGIPESDAMAWYEMGVSLSEGHGLGGGFQNQRPFYSIYLAGLFSLFGVKLSLAQGFNALALAVSSAGLFTIGRLLHTRWLGLVLCISAMTASTHLDYVHAIISENGGTVLAVLSFLTAWQAAWTLSLRWCFAAGLLNGLAALTSGVTLLTLPLYLLILVFFPLSRRVPWRRSLLLGLIYTFAATIPVGSWIARQKIVNDKWTLSYNTSEVLAGGADLETGRLTIASFDKATAAGVDLQNQSERYDYFMRAFKESVASNPRAYLRQLARAFVASIHDLPWRVAGFQLTVLLGLFGFGLWPALIRGQWIAFPIACLLMALWVRSGFDVNPATLTAATFLVWRRCQAPATRLTVALLIATVLATMILAALSGNIATKRFWLVSDWAAFALLLGGAKYLIVTLSALCHVALNRLRAPSWLAGSPNPPASLASAMTPPPFISFSALAWLAFTLLCSVAALAQQFRGPHSSTGPLHHLDLNTVATQGLTRVGTPAQSIASLPLDQLSIRVVSLGDLHAKLHAGEGTQHWMQIYAQRPYPRWVAKFAVLDANGQRSSYINAIGQSTLDAVPRGTPMIAVGILTDSVHRISKLPLKLFEICLLIPQKQSAPGVAWEPDFERQIWFPPTPEALSAVGLSETAPLKR